MAPLIRLYSISDTISAMGLFILFAAALVLIIAVGTMMLIHTIEHPRRKSYGWAIAHDYPTSPADFGLEFSEITVQLADDSITLAWIIEGEQPDRPAVVFSHGWSSSRYQSLPRAAILAKLASKVIIYDQRGQGESQAPKCTYGCKEPADLLTILHQLDKTLDPPYPDSLVVFGSSMGAGVAIEAAATEKIADLPVKLVGLIAEGPYQYGMTPIVRQLWRRRIIPQPMAALAWWHIRFWQGNVKNSDLTKSADKLTVPLLVIHGEDDPISPVQQAKNIANAAPEGDIMIIPDGGHGHLAEEDKQGYIQAIDDFLQRVGTREEKEA